MSYNYYYRPNPNGKLAALADLHLGKAAAGWLFNFQGYKFAGQDACDHQVDVGGNVRVRVQLPALPALELTSAQKWVELMKSDGGQIFGEYGLDYSLDSFVQTLEEFHPERGQVAKTERLRCPFEAARLSKYPPAPGTAWKDEEGYAFTLANFS